MRPTKASNITALADRRGAGKNPTYVELSDDLTVGVRLKNISTMFALGLLPEPLMEAAMKISKKAEGERTVGDIRESVALQDAVCAAVVVDPPYASLSEVEENAGVSIDGKLDIGMMTDDEIGAVFHLVYKGIESWSSFRSELRRRTVVEPSDGDGEETERPSKLDSDPYKDVDGDFAATSAYYA